MARTPAIALLVTIFSVVIIFHQPTSHQAAPSFEKQTNYLFSDSPNSANLSSASSGVALFGEPAYVGDQVTASILVNNEGSSEGFASLLLEDKKTGEIYSGSEVSIPPGSSREISAPFIPRNNGTNDVLWWISSNDSNLDENLAGEFSIEINDLQRIDILVESIIWEDDQELSLDVSIFLSNGPSREISIIIHKENPGPREELQFFSLEMDPGRRSLPLSLGNPDADSLFIEIIPNRWSISPHSGNYTLLQLENRIVDEDTLSVYSTIFPSKPKEGDLAEINVTFQNEGSKTVPPSNFRIILISDNTIISESMVSQIGPSDLVTIHLSIASWPKDEIVAFQQIWSIDEGTVLTSLLEVESQTSDQENSLPFDTMSAIYGIVAGVTIILVSRLAWRAASTRTPSTDDSQIRAPREARARRNEEEKEEISCPFCDQRLKIPTNHVGGAKCPACTMQFNVGDSKKPDTGKDVEKLPSSSKAPIVSENPSVFSDDEFLQCPECDQTLRVPLEKRPIKSRCPVCKNEFIAETGGG